VSLLRVSGHTSFGTIGCGSALLTYALGFAALLGVSLVTVVMPPAFVGPMIIGGVVVIMTVLVPIEYLRRNGPIIRDAVAVLDEGGLRLSVGRSRRYLPVADAELELDAEVLRIRRGWRSVRIVLDDAQEEVAKQLIASHAAMRAEPKAEEEPALVRSNDRLAEWGERVTRNVERQRSETGYRKADRWHDEELLALLFDRKHRPDMRAAAGHALLRLAPQRADAVRRACSGAEPPIVVAMLHAAAPAAFREPFEAIAPFLERRDRQAIR